MALPQSFAYGLVLIFAIQSSCLAAKFAMISMKGRSHYLVLERLGKELETRGHEVTNPNCYLMKMSEYSIIMAMVNPSDL